MRSFVAIFVAFFVGHSAANQCEDKSSGTFFPVPGQCSKYISCHQGQEILMSCPEPFLFNPRETLCDYPDNVPECDDAREECEVATGIHIQPSKKSCQKYIMCLNNNPTEMDCGKGLEFDSVTKKCVINGEGKCDVNPCVGAADGSFVPSHRCTEYFICIRESGLRQTCPSGTGFSTSQLNCVAKDESNCGPSGRGAQQFLEAENPYEKLPMKPVKPSDVKCPDEVGLHFYPNPYDCNFYLLCYNGKASFGRCNSGLAFDVVKMACVEKSQAKCSDFDPIDDSENPGFEMVPPSMEFPEKKPLPRPEDREREDPIFIEPWLSLDSIKVKPEKKPLPRPKQVDFEQPIFVQPLPQDPIFPDPERKPQDPIFPALERKPQDPVFPPPEVKPQDPIFPAPERKPQDPIFPVPERKPALDIEDPIFVKPSPHLREKLPDLPIYQLPMFRIPQLPQKPSKIKCPKNTGKHVFPNPYDCRFFLVCDEGVGFFSACANGKAYDATAKKCIDRDVARCGPSEAENSLRDPIFKHPVKPIQFPRRPGLKPAPLLH